MATSEEATAAATRDAYGAMSGTYQAFVREQFPRQTYDLALLSVFADLVRDTGPVADIGCGPGHVTAHLDRLGVSAFGIDLTPEFTALARAAYPGLRFETGTMLDLRPHVPGGGSLAGVLGWYSLIHLPPAQVPLALAEFHRVLAPGGHLLLGFQSTAAGAAREPVPFDHKVTPGWLWPVDTFADALTAAGFTVSLRSLREPGADYHRHQGYLLAVREG
ncbi:class I SAM-dependent methyltransferase [Streptomyces xiamenensis]